MLKDELERRLAYALESNDRFGKQNEDLHKVITKIQDERDELINQVDCMKATLGSISLSATAICKMKGPAK